MIWSGPIFLETDLLVTPSASCPNVVIFPVPCSSVLNFTTRMQGKHSYRITDVRGTIILEGISPSNTHEIDVCSLKPGLYVITINAAGQSVSGSFVRK
jgi:hypothetical protein